MDREDGHDAELHDGSRPGGRPARVHVRPEGVRVTTPDGTSELWEFAQLSLVRGQSRGEPVQLEHRSHPVQVVIVTDPGFRDALWAAIPRGRRLRGTGGVRVGARALVLALVLLVLGALAAWRFGVPALADALAERVPREWEAGLGEQAVADFAPPGKRVEDPVVAGPVQRIYARLVAAGAAGREPTRLVVARHDLVNAFAAPGGVVVVTTGLLRAVRSPEELAAVLAHEAGHVRRRHALRGMLRQASLQVLLGLVAGDPSALSTALRAAGELGGLSYSREHEAEADLDALESLARAGLPPGALAGALESIRGASRGGPEMGFLSTHPSTPDRLRRIERSLATRPPVVPQALVTAAEWRALRDALPAPAGAGARP